jgi:hypothetical protein
MKEEAKKIDYWGLGALLFFGTLIGSMGIMMVAIPTDFFNFQTSTTQFRQINMPDYFSLSRDAENLKWYINGTIERSIIAVSCNFDFNAKYPQDFPNTLYFSFRWFSIGDVMSGIRIEKWNLPYMYRQEYFLNKSLTACSYWLATQTLQDEVSIIEPVFDDYWTETIFLSDYDGTRNNFASAWGEGKLNMTLAFGNANGTNQMSLNGWDLVTRVLTFQAWDLCGSPMINFLIDLPIWIGTAYITIRIVRLFIPFLSGN